MVARAPIRITIATVADDGQTRSGRLASVNVGRPAAVGQWRGHTIRSGIAKAPVAGRVAVEGANLVGDQQADLSVHGGPDKAVYAYAREDEDWWADALGREIPAGMFGENLTTVDVDCSGAVIGERWRVGSVELEVCQPRLPCFKLGLRFGDGRMLRRFAHASRPGAYLRIVREGELGPGDAIEVVDRPGHGVTIALVADAILLDETLLERAGSAPQLPAELRDWMTQRG
jgi:MOSC domain-containing protein YiiM